MCIPRYIFIYSSFFSSHFSFLIAFIRMASLFLSLSLFLYVCMEIYPSNFYIKSQFLKRHVLPHRCIKTNRIHYFFLFPFPPNLSIQLSPYSNPLISISILLSRSLTRSLSFSFYLLRTFNLCARSQSQWQVRALLLNVDMCVGCMQAYSKHTHIYII